MRRRRCWRACTRRSPRRRAPRASSGSLVVQVDRPAAPLDEQYQLLAALDGLGELRDRLDLAPVRLDDHIALGQTEVLGGAVGLDLDHADTAAVAAAQARALREASARQLGVQL